MKKPVHWIGSSLKDLKGMPDGVRREAGFSIWMAQKGDKATNVVALVGFGGAKVLEIIIDDDGSTYRAVYTVKFAQAIYVLHAFQKKAKKGIATPKHDMDLIHHRLKTAEAHYKQTYEQVERKVIANENGA
jgi:phage-related protein